MSEPVPDPRDESGWLPMSDAPRDGTVILGRTRSDMPEDESLPQWSAHRWNDRYVPMKHEGRTPSDYDLGWSVALPVGHGGLPDDWFIGWQPLVKALPTPNEEVE